MIAAKCVLLLAFLCTATAVQVTPIEQVIELISSLEAKIIKEGEVEQKAYEEFVEWCDDAAKNNQFAIKTATAEKEKLEAAIAKATSNAEEATATIADLAGSIAEDESNLQNATEIRDKEHADFAASEAELMDAVDTLERAIGILEKNAKGSALVQTPVDPSKLNALLATLSAAIDTASAFSGHDKTKLLALVQNRQKDEDDDSDFGAPAPDAYKSHSSSIIDVLEDMKDKAETELSELRKAEVNAQHNYDMLKQALTDEIAAANHEKTEAEMMKTENEGARATAEGDLAQTVKDLADAQNVLATLSGDCMTTAQDHEVSMKGRAEELKALAEAKKIIQSTTAGAGGQTYSFLQINTISQLHTVTDLRNFEVVNMVKKLAQQQHSTELAQLASRIAATMRYSAASGEDPFAKVKGLITEMIDRLMKEAEAEASQKAYCDEEMAKNKAKKEELNTDIKKLTSKIDTASARSTDLKGQVAELQKELADLQKMQAEMDKVRADTKAAFTQAKSDLEQGITGVENALSVLRDYYATEEEAAALVQQPSPPVTHSKASGAGGGIISMLEVILSDFTKGLAEQEAEESAAQADYEKQTQENKVTKTLKEQDVKYKTKEFQGLDKDVAELSSDREGLQTELDAVMEYGEKIKDMCVAKPMTYEERKKRREAEIAGLKEALAILEGEAVFVQKGHASLRGIAAHSRV